MITPAEYFGGQTTLTTSVSTSLTFQYRVWRVNVTQTLRTITLPATTTPNCPIGSPALIVANVGANAFQLDAFFSLAVGKVCIFGTYKLANGNILWLPDVRNYTSY